MIWALLFLTISVSLVENILIEGFDIIPMIEWVDIGFDRDRCFLLMEHELHYDIISVFLVTEEYDLHISCHWGHVVGLECITDCIGLVYRVVAAFESKYACQRNQVAIVAKTQCDSSLARIDCFLGRIKDIAQ